MCPVDLSEFNSIHSFYFVYSYGILWEEKERNLRARIANSSMRTGEITQILRVVSQVYGRTTINHHPQDSRTISGRKQCPYFVHEDSDSNVTNNDDDAAAGDRQESLKLYLECADCVCPPRTESGSWFHKRGAWYLKAVAPILLYDNK